VKIGDLTGRCENGLDAWHLKVGTLTPKWQFSWGKKWKHANMNPDFQTLRHSQPAQIGICYSSSHPANWINRFAAMLCKSYST
jgi:hypothetical protein